MKKKRRIRLMVLLGLSMIGVTGCMSKKEADRAAVEKFKEKYGVDCEIVYNEVIDDSVENRDEIHVYVDKWMEKGETAVIYSWKEKEKAVSEDNLFGFIIREDYEKAAREAVTCQFSDAKVYVSYVSSAFSDTLTRESTLEDAYSAGEKMITYMDIIVVSQEEKEVFEQKAESVCDELKEAKLYGNVRIYAVSEEAYERMDRMNYDETIQVNGYEPDGVNTFAVYKGKSFGR